jgi:hypothetical protein
MRRAPDQSIVASVLALSAALVAGSTNAAAASPTLAKGPYLTALSDAAVEVRFELDAPAAASVELEATEGAGDAAAGPTVADGPAAMHVVRVTGLTPATAYAYTVRAGGAVVGGGHLVTAPRPDAGKPVTFLLYGDTRQGETANAALVRAMLATPSDFLVNTGDIVAAGGNPSDWEEFFRLEQPLLRDRPLFLCIGNHELSDDQAGASFARYFGFDGTPDAPTPPQPYGTMRWGAARFFFLNGMHDWNRGPEREWLERELTKADTEAGLVWRLAVVHHAPWSSGPHGSNAKLRDALVPELLGAHKVDLLLAGHDHIYERGEHADSPSLKYVISGGGGAPLYPVEHRLPTTRKAESAFHFVSMTLTGNDLRMVAHRLDGTTLESCGFTKGRPWDCDAPSKAGPPGTPAEGISESPASAPSTASRCGCIVPGAPAGVGMGAWLALAGVTAAAVAVARRRRG